MLNCCAELRREIQLLRKEIAALNQIDEESIIRKAIDGAKRLLEPQIVAVGITAGTALSNGFTFKAILDAFIAFGRPILLSLGRLVPVVGILLLLAQAGIIAASEYTRLQAAIAQLRSELAKLRDTTAKALGKAIAADSTARKVDKEVDILNDYVKVLERRLNRKIEDGDRKLKTQIEKAEFDLNNRISATRDTLRLEITNAKNQLNAEIASARNDLQYEFRTNDERIRANISQLEANYKAADAQLDRRLLEQNLSVALASNKADTALNTANNLRSNVTSLNNRVGNAEAVLRDTIRQVSTISNTASTANSTANRSYGLSVTASTGLTKLEAELGKYQRTTSNLATVTASTGITAEKALQEQQRQRGEINSLKSDIAVTNTSLNQKVETFSRVTISPEIIRINKEIADINSRIKEREDVDRKALSDLADIKAYLPALAPVVAGAVVARVPNLSQINATTKEAVCSEARPGGCLGGPLNQIQGNQNRILQGLDAATQAGQGVLLNSINNGVLLLNKKIGDFPLVGGVSGAINNILNSSITDRVVNLVTMAGVIHNCMMLSTSIADTLFSTLDNIFAIPTLVKDPNGQTIDTKTQFTQYLDKFFSDLFGTTEWRAIKAQWKAYSTIYNTGSQVFGNVRDIFSETQEIQNTTNRWVGELGNALQDEGVIGEDNWDTKDPKFKIRGKYFDRLNRIAEGLQSVESVFEDLNQVTGSARNIVQTANEIKENVSAVEKAVDEANKAAKADREAKIEGLELPNFSLADFLAGD